MPERRHGERRDGMASGAASARRGRTRRADAAPLAALFSHGGLTPRRSPHCPTGLCRRLTQGFSYLPASGFFQFSTAGGGQ
jgi:hypothetical protein